MRTGSETLQAPPFVNAGRRKAGSGALVCALAFGLAAAGTAGVLHVTLPPVQDMVHARLTRIPEEGRVDIFFLGSSYTDLGVDVEIFMEEMGKLGHPMRAVNLGMFGCREFDKEFLIRQGRERLSEASYLVDESMVNWTSIYINPGSAVREDLNDFEAFMARLNSPRSVEWHDATTLLKVIRYSGDIWPNDRARQMKEIGLGLLPTVRHYLPAGRINPGVYDEPWVNRAARTEERPLGSRTEDAEAVVEDYLEKIRENDALRGKPDEEIEARGVGIMRARMKRIAALGPKYVAVLSPSPTAENRLTEKVLRLADPGVAILSYDDREEHADLWDPVNRLDYGHLNRPGVEIYSRRLARDFVARVLGGEAVGGMRGRGGSDGEHAALFEKGRESGERADEGAAEARGEGGGRGERGHEGGQAEGMTGGEAGEAPAVLVGAVVFVVGVEAGEEGAGEGGDVAAEVVEAFAEQGKPLTADARSQPAVSNNSPRLARIASLIMRRFSSVGREALNL
jgi:hypothetical protein